MVGDHFLAALSERRPFGRPGLRPRRPARARRRASRAWARRPASTASGRTRKRSTHSPRSPRPRPIYRYDVATGKSTVWRQPKLSFDPRRLRDDAGLLPEQGRHPDPDVPEPQEGAEARRPDADAALRLRRVQHLADAELQPVPSWSGWRWAGSSPCPTCAAAANTARTGTRPARSSRSRTSSTTSSPRPSG